MFGFVELLRNELVELVPFVVDCTAGLVNECNEVCLLGTGMGIVDFVLVISFA